MQRLQVFAVLLFALSKGVLEGWTQDAMSAHEARVNRLDSFAIRRCRRTADIIVIACSNMCQRVMRYTISNKLLHLAASNIVLNIMLCYSARHSKASRHALASNSVYEAVSSQAGKPISSVVPQIADLIWPIVCHLSRELDLSVAHRRGAGTNFNART